MEGPKEMKDSVIRTFHVLKSFENMFWKCHSMTFTFNRTRIRSVPGTLSLDLNTPS